MDKSECIVLLENELNRLNQFEHAYVETIDELISLLSSNEKSKYDFTRVLESQIDPNSRESMDKQKIRIFQNNPSLLDCENNLKKNELHATELEMRKKKYEMIMTNIRLKITTCNTVISYY